MENEIAARWSSKTFVESRRNAVNPLIASVDEYTGYALKVLKITAKIVTTELANSQKFQPDLGASKLAIREV